MIDVLCSEPAQRRIAVLGEMLELGSMSETLHREIGSYAARAGMDALVGIRGAAAFLVDEARRAGMSERQCSFLMIRKALARSCASGYSRAMPSYLKVRAGLR